MSRSRARLAADWFAKLRQNAVTNEVEHTNVTDVAADVADVSSDVTTVSNTALNSGSSLNAANLTGTLPAIDGSALTGISTTPTSAQVGSATAGLSVSSVGAYALLGVNSANDFVRRYPNSTLAGSNLLYGAGNIYQAGSIPSGTWRLMGFINNSGTQVSVWLRIS